MQIFGPAADALNSLTPAQIDFLERLPKAELHAHLNGSIPLSLLQELATEHLSAPGAQEDPTIRAALEALRAGPALAEIHDFFHLFPAIYALTSTPRALTRAADAVLATFLEGERPQCAYLELRTTPRATPAMNRAAYLATVLDSLERYPHTQAGLIVSIDRRMGTEVIEECVTLACTLREQGRRVVGVDLCGDPLAGDMALLGPHLARAQAAGLGVTLHIAEVRTPFSPRCYGYFIALPCRPLKIPRKKRSNCSPTAQNAWGTPHSSTQKPSRSSSRRRCASRFAYLPTYCKSSPSHLPRMIAAQ